MRTGIHPENYRLVAFKDMSNDDVFISKSTVNTKETIEFEGAEYPLVKLEIPELLTLSTLVNLNWLILQVELTSSKISTPSLKKKIKKKAKINLIVIFLN